MPSEFDLIRQYFAAATAARADVDLAIGDDCALLKPPPGQLLAVTMDTLVEGRHFLPGTEPRALGHKCLAVNLSDLAAMGADPAWVTLAMTMPSVNKAWLGGFMKGFAALAREYEVQLVGGDTTRGPLTITVQAQGFVARDHALTRAEGRVGDCLFVSGCVGDAALALRLIQAGEPVEAQMRQRLDQPMPHVALGKLLRGVASAAIDISDGLAADLQHLCAASGVGAVVNLADLPLSPAVAAVCEREGWQLPLGGGDDYQLLFSVPPERITQLSAACADANLKIKAIGRLVDTDGITLIDPDGHETQETPDGFDHFKD